jgi:hypothetical protein
MKYMRAWNKIMGLPDKEIDYLILAAENLNAPKDSIYYTYDGISGKRKWHRFSEIQDEQTKKLFEAFLKESE